MRIFTLFLCFCIIPFITIGQITSNLSYEDIAIEIVSESSDYYYPVLMEKYISNDVSMTLEEGLHLYYGWIFQTEYNPVESSPYQDSLSMFMNSEYGHSEDYELLLSFCDLVLEDDPFNLNVLNYKLYFCKKLDLEDYYTDAELKLSLVSKIILLSGEGLSMSDAMYVIDQSHVQYMVRKQEHTYFGESTIMNDFQYLKTSKDGLADMLYFNIEPSLNYVSEM